MSTLQSVAADSKRVSLACQRCRHSKLKCSGTQPCDRCARKSRACVYDEPFNNIRPPDHQRSFQSPGVIREQVELGRKLNNSRKRLRSEEASTPAVDKVHEPTLPSLRPRVSNENPAIYQRNRPDKRRRWLYLGSSSTASFNVRVAALLYSKISSDENSNAINFTLDGDAYKVAWNRIRSDELPDLSDLPSVDYATYLVNTVKFHLDSLFQLFDGEDFFEHMHDFYADAAAKVKSHRLWFTQYLLIMAFGKGLLNLKRTHGSLAGSDFFCRAMSILPETSSLHEEPVLAGEVLCLVSLYFYCLDMRQTAYSYIGQALRIALVEGNHTYLEGSQLGEKLAKRCTNLWWTVYILDRTLSSVVGVPPSLSDRHIKTTPPQVAQSSQRTATVGLHVKLSRLVSDILTELYSADGSLETSYLAKTRSILRDMAQVGEEIEETIDFKFKNSLETVSKGATHLRLMYHQCIILATRPLLLCLLQEKLKSITTQVDGQLGVLPPVQDLVQACVESATKTLYMLSALSKNNMLDCFLPFDLDFACSAASILILVDDIIRCMTVDSYMKRLSDKIMDEMVDAGNNAAILRKNELQQLRQLARRLRSLDVVNRNASDQESEVQQTARVHIDDKSPTRNNQTSESQILSPNQFDETMTQLSTNTPQDLAHNFDLSHEQMLLIADQLDVNALTSNLEFHEFGRLDWLEL